MKIALFKDAVHFSGGVHVATEKDAENSFTDYLRISEWVDVDFSMLSKAQLEVASHDLTISLMEEANKEHNKAVRRVLDRQGKIDQMIGEES